MKLKKLTLENFRGFKHFECNFQQGINVLVGLNGHGKTSLLDAISVAYGQFMSGFGTSVDRGISVEEVHLDKIGNENDGFTMEYQLPSIIQAQTYPSDFVGFPSDWQRQKSSTKKNSRTTQVRSLKEYAHTLQKLVQDGGQPMLPVIALYGTDRLWNQNFNPSGIRPKLSKTSRLEGYSDWLRPRSSYARFVDWLYQETIASYERKLEIQELIEKGNSLVKGNPHQENLNALKGALDKILEPSGWSNVRYSPTARQIVVTHQDQGDIPVSMLSDGVRNMLGMIADIAYRSIRLNPHLGSRAVRETQGIVLIDEVDMHLHPQWQQLVLKNLEEAFPKIQFIVTTHSPQVLTTVRKNQVIILKGECAQSPIGNTFGEPSSYVLNHVLGVDSRPPLDYSESLKRYLILVESGFGKDEEALKIRSELEAQMGENHSDLIAADRTIKRKELLG